MMIADTYRVRAVNPKFPEVTSRGDEVVYRGAFARACRPRSEMM
jgi:hypothetical protein